MATNAILYSGLTPRVCQSRDLVLAVQSTGDLRCVYACVKNTFLFCFWVYSHNCHQMV